MGTGPSGETYQIGEMAGSEEVTLSIQQIPAHSHPLLASANLASSNTPREQVLATTQASTITSYGQDNPLVTLSPSAVAPVGGSQPHTNFQPYLCVNYIISLFGLFPSQT
jgi:microcystin-dependent protein